MKKLKLIRQEESKGCGIACIATVLGRTYESVRNDFLGDVGEEGLSLEQIMDYIGDHQRTLVHKYVRNYSHKDICKNELLVPFAPIHVLRTIPYANSGVGHLAILDGNGVIHCPDGFTDEFIRGSYAITDVVGIYKDTDFKQSKNEISNN